MSASDQHGMTVLIRKLESIATLTNAERRAIESLPVRVRTLDARQDIVRDGDKPSHCCLILGGWACRYKLLSQGRRQILSFHIPGDIPDLQTLHLQTMDHSVATMKVATVAFIPHEDLQELTADFPRIGALLWRSTLIDAATFREWETNLGRRPAFERMAHLFCELYLKLHAVGLADDYRCPMPITQADLADALGLTSVHVNRVLKELRAQTLITLRSSTLVIQAWDELQRVCEFDPTYLHLEKGTA
jgi:CRP-like cAMP-binding protein